MKYYDYVLREIPEYKNIDYANTTLIAYVHILENNKDFFYSLVRMGFDVNKIVIFGKSYSTNPNVVKQLSNSGMSVFNVGWPEKLGNFYDSAEKEIKFVLRGIKPTKNIIIMESGGVLRELVKELFYGRHDITGIELTTQGIYKNNVFPTINVARSDTKLTDEPEVVSKRAYEMMIARNLINKDKVYGIIGNGIIGNNLYKYMKRKGHNIIIFDKKFDNENILNKVKTESDYIIGATGVDCLKDYRDLKNGCSLISISSGDIEFNSLLKYVDTKCDKNNLFSDINIRNVYIINGGFPITFDRINGAEDREILITYGLWFVGIIQSGLNTSKKVELIDLDRGYQTIVKNALLHSPQCHTVKC